MQPKTNPLSAKFAVELLPIDSLRPQTKNSRTHSKRQIRKIAESIRAFGFINPVLIDQDDNIVAGHGRVRAAKLTGMSEVPTLRIEHLTPDELRAYIIADNRLAEDAGWDADILKIELQHLLDADVSFDVTVTGFEIPEIDLRIHGISSKSDSDKNIHIEAGPTVCKLGDLWHLGPHRVICGNSSIDETYQQLMAKDKAAAICTDPPYNVPISGHVSGLGRARHREFANASGEMSDAEFTAFLRQIFVRLASYSLPGSLHYIFMDWRHGFELQTAAREVYSELKNIVVWVKDTAGMGSFYRSQHELVFIFKNGKGKHQNNIQLGKFGRDRSNVWKYSGINAFAGQTEEGRLGLLHPTVKPVGMVADALLDCTSPDDIVLDVFLGSGTTLLAAERTRRHCRAIEIDPLYVDIAIRRWQLHTGGRAIHAESGLSFDDIALNMVEPANG